MKKGEKNTNKMDTWSKVNQ